MKWGFWLVLILGFVLGISVAESASTPIVIQVKGNEVFIELGKTSGVQPGDMVQIMHKSDQFLDPDTGEYVGFRSEVVANVQIVQVLEYYSVGNILDIKPGAVIKKMDQVLFIPPTVAIPADSQAVLADTTLAKLELEKQKTHASASKKSNQNISAPKMARHEIAFSALIRNDDFGSGDSKYLVNGSYGFFAYQNVQLGLMTSIDASPGGNSTQTYGAIKGFAALHFFREHMVTLYSGVRSGKTFGLNPDYTIYGGFFGCKVFPGQHRWGFLIQPAFENVISETVNNINTSQTQINIEMGIVVVF